MLAEQLTPGNRPALTELAGEFETTDWTREAIGAAIKAAAARHGIKPPQVMMPLAHAGGRDTEDARDRCGARAGRP